MKLVTCTRVAVGALGAMVLVAACGSESDDGSAGTDSVKVRIALVSNTTGFADALVAYGGGFFEDHGLDAELLAPIPQPATILQTAVSGEADITGVPPSSVFAADETNREVSVVARTANTPTSVVVATSDFVERQNANGVTVDSSPEERVKALDGALMGVAARGPGGEAAYRALFDHYDVPVDDDRFAAVGGGPTGLDAAIKTQQVDTVYTGLPAGLNPGAEGYGDVWLGPQDYAELEPWTAGTFCYVSSTSWADEHPEAVEGFQAALDEARELITDDPAEAARLFLKVATEEDPARTEEAFRMIQGSYEGSSLMDEDYFEKNRIMYDTVADRPSDLSYEKAVWAR